MTYALGVAAALGSLVFVLDLLRRGILRERFAVLWLLVTGLTLLLALFPDLLRWAADVVGVEVPSNLLFVAGGFVLLLVSVQLSWEVSVLDARSRRLAEEIAILRLEVDRLNEPKDQ